jgi:hypothetical protein
MQDESIENGGLSMKAVTSTSALALWALFSAFAAQAEDARSYAASPGYWRWVESMNFAQPQAEPAKSSARPFTANDNYWTWMDSMNFAPVNEPQAAGRPFTANDHYWTWIDAMRPGEGGFVGTKAKGAQ